MDCMIYQEEFYLYSNKTMQFQSLSAWIRQWYFRCNLLLKKILATLPYEHPEHTFELWWGIEVEYMKYKFSHKNKKKKTLYVSIMPIGAVFRIVCELAERKQNFFLFSDYKSDIEWTDAFVEKISTYETK